MSKEQKFHEWIEEQYREEKDRVWESILQKEEERGLSSAPEKARKKTGFRWNKWATAVASAVAVFAVGTFCLVKFLPQDTPDGGGDGNRYFTAENYRLVETENKQTLKDVVEETGKPLLYFDWYDGVTEQTFTYQVGEGDTAEIIGYRERLMDAETGYLVELHITDTQTQLDIFDYKETNFQETVVQEVSVDWRIYSGESIAYFEYGGYKYLMKVMDTTEEGYILSLVERLLP